MYIVETVRDGMQYHSYLDSHLELSGRHFFGYQLEPLHLDHSLLKY